MKKKRKIDWLNHALEFFVVIIGILIAFQLNECSADSEKEKTVSIHLNEIKEEALFNKTNFQYAIKGAEKSLRKTDSLLYLLESKEDIEAVNRLSLELLNLSGVYIRRNAYSSIIESGDIRLIKDFNVKKRIINLYEYYKWVELYNQLSYSDYETNFSKNVAEHLDLVNNEIQKPEIYYSRPYKNAIATYRFALNNKLKKYRDCLIEIDNYLDEAR